MTAANCWPSCSRLTRCATAVFGLKKAVQFAAIVFASAAVLAEVEEDDADGAAAADDGAVVGVELVVLLPLLQAARLPPTVQASRIKEANLRVFTWTFSSFCDQRGSREMTPASAVFARRGGHVHFRRFASAAKRRRSASPR